MKTQLPLLKLLKSAYLFAILLASPSWALAQCVPIPNAIPGVALRFVQGGGTNSSGVAYNPNDNVYYAAIAGNSGFPLETFDAAGAPLYQTNTGFDMRGLWWNFTANQLESNGYNSLGVWAYNLNASGYALNTGTSIFTGLNQPTSQSVGDFNCTDDEIWYYNAGAIMKRNRATNALIGTFPITGLPVSTANLNNNTVFYTDCLGHEIGLVDRVNKAILFVDKTTMAYKGRSVLPAATVTNTSFRASWANGMAWLYDVGTRTWHSFQVLQDISGVCTTLLSVGLLSFDAIAKENKTVDISWTTTSEVNNDYFTIERSLDAIAWEEVAEVDGAGNSSVKLDYKTLDENPYLGVSYYRLKQTNIFGQFSYSEIRAVNLDAVDAQVRIYPNPVEDKIIVEGPTSKIEAIAIYNVLGEDITSFVTILGRSDYRVTIDLSELAAGVYVIKTNTSTKKITKL